MRNIIPILVLFFSISLGAQTSVEQVNSVKLNGSREITVKLPASYAKNPERKYPLILVLDGEFLFSPFEGNLAYGNYWDDIPEVILVGISQNKKEERYDDSEFNPATGLPSGKGGAFFEFIGSELLPYLDQKYRVAPFRIIAGLDTTAGFINSFLYKDMPIFNGYISMSPELAKGMEDRIPQRLNAIKEPVFYYQATSDGDLKKFQTQIKALDQNIVAVKNPLLNYKFDDFKGASHYSLVLNAIPSALSQIFAVYRPISSLEYQEKIAILPSEHVKYLTDKYDVIEKSLGIKMNVRLNDFKAIEAAILKSGDFKGYEELAQISGQQYEKSMLYDYHMAMFHEKNGDIKKAIKFYQNAFMKEEIAGLTKDMMMNKAEDLKSKLPKKEKLKGGKAKDKEAEATTEEVAPTEEVVPTEAPVDPPTETPKEEKKPE
ncbi:alpha/beta hydrolase-fold protein [Flavobacterium sp.]|uniref:alpha/beta hydrolase n=1 Tax=Flavobacterium sp. TaxID=239 RepID=UPI00261AA37D|nr:alpha/beta hydrolase-fold protein [Flavobacterium sp.]